MNFSLQASHRLTEKRKNLSKVYCILLAQCTNPLTTLLPLMSWHHSRPPLVRFTVAPSSFSGEPFSSSTGELYWAWAPLFSSGELGPLHSSLVTLISFTLLWWLWAPLILLWWTWALFTILWWTWALLILFWWTWAHLIILWWTWALRILLWWPWALLILFWWAWVLLIILWRTWALLILLWWTWVLLIILWWAWVLLIVLWKTWALLFLLWWTWVFFILLWWTWALLILLCWTCALLILPWWAWAPSSSSGELEPLSSFSGELGLLHSSLVSLGSFIVLWWAWAPSSFSGELGLLHLSLVNLSPLIIFCRVWALHILHGKVEASLKGMHSSDESMPPLSWWVLILFDLLSWDWNLSHASLGELHACMDPLSSTSDELEPIEH